MESGTDIIDPCDFVGRRRSLNETLRPAIGIRIVVAVAKVNFADVAGQVSSFR